MKLMVLATMMILVPRHYPQTNKKKRLNFSHHTEALKTHCTYANWTIYIIFIFQQYNWSTQSHSTHVQNEILSANAEQLLCVTFECNSKYWCLHTSNIAEFLMYILLMSKLNLWIKRKSWYWHYCGYCPKWKFLRKIIYVF